ncbi:MAG TPA: porin family protein [Chitinophagales bacterium]|nr:porin family protein [Chitinophagales bacterium]
MIAIFCFSQFNFSVRLCLVAALIFLSPSSFAQVNDTANYFPPPPGNNPGVSSVLRSQKHLLFIDITQNTWLHLPDGVTPKYISGGFNISIFYDFFVAKKIFGIAPGISFSNSTVKTNAFLNYYYDNTFHIDSVALTPLEDTVDLKVKISTSYFDIPLELRFRIKPDERGKNFWFAPGFRAGILLSDFQKSKGKDPNGTMRKIKDYEIPFVENFHYGISLRAGYYKFGVYAFYSLTSLFEKNRGPDLVPFSVGIALTPL